MRRRSASLESLSRTPWLVLVVAAVLLCAPHATQAQTVCAVPGKDGAATISGVVNTYHQGTVTANAGTASITVGSSRIGGASTPISEGDLLLVIQMQDATFNSTNGASYGDAGGANVGSGWTALNNAGLYEYVVATNTIALGGGTITIRGTGAGSGLRNTYTNAASNASSGQKRFQVIRVPQYSTATLSAVTAPAWDGSTGGLVAFDVAGALNLTGGSVNVTGLGFRGGGSRNLDGDKSNPIVALATDHALSSSYPVHGSKGEGIAGTPRYVYNASTGMIDDTLVEGYPGGSHARGAPGNAGGGGTDSDPNDNQENSGGGGGSNGGAGGRGGNTWQLNAAVGGYGGASFAGSAATNRIIMGGGGGGGTKNNDIATAASTGAAGGGIVMIRAGSYSGSATINANGANAYDDTENDGGGGGGAGGSVIVMGASGLGGFTINVRGGTGGDAWPDEAPNGDPGARHGPGGGGSGGVVYYSSAGGAPGVNRNGGAAGTTTTAASTYGATAGANGPAAANITFAATQGASPSYLCLPSLTTTKTTTTASVTNSPTGTTATYRITVANAANLGSAISVNISDTLPTNFTYASTSSIITSGNATQNPTTNPTAGATIPSWGVFTIPGGGQVQITFVVNISRVVLTGTYQNPARANYLDPLRTLASPNNTLNVDYNPATSTGEDVTVTSRADMTIAKTHTGNFTQGQVGAQYTLTVSNIGSGQTTGAVNVSDTLPAGLTPTGYTAAAPWNCSINLQVVACSRSDALVAPNSYSTIVITVNVSQTAPASLTNTASVSGGGQTNTANDTSSDPTTINQLPDLRVTKTHAGNFTQGQNNASYIITVNNAGNGATSGMVTVTDTLPAGLSFDSASPAAWNCGAIGQVVTCSRSDSLPALSSYPAITLYVDVATNAPASVTNTVAVSGGGEIITNNNSASDPTTINGVPDLTITKTHTGNFTQGQVGAQYTLTVTNSGTASTNGSIVNVTDTLPAGLTPTGYTAAAPWNCSINLQVVACSRSTVLAASNSYSTITINVNVSATAPASVTNTASVSGGGETNTGNNSASDPTTINQLADLTITKSHTGDFTRGTNDTYTITVTNSGTVATNGTTVTVTDTLPAGLTPTPWTGSGWTCAINLQVVTCQRANVLNPGISYPAISIPVIVLQSAAASVTNTATVSGGGQVNTANDSASDPTNIVSRSDLSLTKVTNNSGNGVGTQATFTITLTNTGPSDATGVAVRDQLPAGLTYVSSFASLGSYSNVTGIWTIGNVTSGLSPTLQITASINVVGSITNTAQVSASNQPDPDSTPDNNNATEDDQASSNLTTSPPHIALCKTIQGEACPPAAPLNLPPGSDITYVITFLNDGGSMAQNVVITDPSLPPISTLKLNDYTYFKVGSIQSTLPGGMSVTDIKYSDDAGLTWNYLPSSGGGGAPAGYDANVTHLQVFYGGQLTPGSSGNVSFTVRIR